MDWSVAGIVKQLYRTPEEARQSTEPEMIRRKDALFYGGLALVAALFVPTVLQQLLTWERSPFDVLVPAESWRAVYDSSPKCDFDATKNARCFANPSNPKLWVSQFSRSDGAHLAATEARRHDVYWIGAAIPPSVLRQAATTTANHLILGWVRGTTRLWVDGEYVSAGTWADNEPFVLPISMKRLSEPRPLRVAIEIVNDAEVRGLPDTFDFKGGQAGFARKAAASSWRKMQATWTTARPMALFIANMLLAVVFFLIWSTAKEKQEYFYIALYAFASGLVQFKIIDLFYLSVSRGFLNTYGVLATGYYSMFSMLLGFSFARMRPSLMRFALVVSLALPVALALVVRDPMLQQRIQSLFYERFTVACGALGAAACFAQAWLLRRGRRSGVALPVREARLLAYGGALAIIALGGLLESLHLNGVLMVFHRTSSIILLFVMGMIALRDYHEEHQLVSKVPVSPYHQRPQLPESIAGAMLVLDLKNSEKLLRLGSDLGLGGELIDTCISHMWTVVAEAGGVVLRTEGDQIRAFFETTPTFPAARSDAPDRVDVERVALRVAERIHERLRDLAEQLGTHYVVDGGISLEFRAGLATGTIRPVWHEIGTLRYPDWVEAGTSNVFIESTRLMDLDYSLPSKAVAVETRVVINEELAIRLCATEPQLAARFTARNLTLKSKHGREYCAAFFLPAAGRANSRKIRTAA